MTCPTLVVLLGIALIAFSQRPGAARRPARRRRPVRRARPPVRAVARLLFDLVLIPFQLLIVSAYAFGPKNSRSRPKTASRKNR